VNNLLLSPAGSKVALIIDESMNYKFQFLIFNFAQFVM